MPNPIYEQDNNEADDSDSELDFDLSSVSESENILFDDSTIAEPVDEMQSSEPLHSPNEPMELWFESSLEINLDSESEFSSDDEENQEAELLQVRSYWYNFFNHSPESFHHHSPQTRPNTPSA